MLNSDNVVILSGRLTADAKEVMDGKMVTFSVAIDRSGYDQNSDSDAGFFNCKIWMTENKWTAPGVTESIRDLMKVGRLNKGAPVRVIGQLHHERYTDNNGNKRSEVSVVVESISSFAKSNAGSTSDDTETSAPTKTAVAGGAEPF